MGILPNIGLLATFLLYAILAIYLVFKRPGITDATLIVLSALLLISALFFQLMTYEVLPFILLFLVFGYGTRSRFLSLKCLSWVGMVCCALAFSLHLVPGFQNALIFETESLGLSTFPYKLYANLDKAIAGLIIIIFSMNKLRSFSPSVFRRKDLPLIVGSWMIVFGCAWFMGVPIDQKIVTFLLAFAFFNLFVTCLAEEAFFRLVLQEGIWRSFPVSKLAPLAGIVFSAILFTLAHFHTGEDAEKRLVLIFVAGICYAVVYWRSRLLISAILAHFSINLIHLLFFAYPAVFR